MSLDTTFPRLADDLHDEVSEQLGAYAREAGVRIVPESIRVCVSRDVRLAAAVSREYAASTFAGGAKEPVVGVFYIQGRVGGDLPGPGFYVARVVRDGNQRLVVVADKGGKDVLKVPVTITCDPEPVAAASSGCCSQPTVGENYICTGFSCCNEIGGCITHEFCFAI